MLSTQLTSNTLNVMYQYIFQFRQMCVASAQVNLTIKHIFLCEPLSTPQNLTLARTQKQSDSSPS